MNKEVTDVMRNLTIAHCKNMQETILNLQSQKEQIDQRIAELQNEIQTGASAVNAYESHQSEESENDNV